MALDLGVVDVEEIWAKPNWQVVRWRAFYAYRRAMEEEAMNKARNARG